MQVCKRARRAQTSAKECFRVKLQTTRFETQRQRDENKNETCAFEGVGPRGQRGKSSRNAAFRGNATTINFKVKNLLSRTFDVVAQAPRNDQARELPDSSVSMYIGLGGRFLRFRLRDIKSPAICKPLFGAPSGCGHRVLSRESLLVLCDHSYSCTYIHIPFL